MYKALVTLDPLASPVGSVSLANSASLASHHSHDALTPVRALPPMSARAVQHIRALEAAARMLPQVDIATSHALHAGLYARTVMIPAGVVLTGAEIKIDTVLIISGHVLVNAGEPGSGEGKEEGSAEDIGDGSAEGSKQGDAEGRRVSKAAVEFCGYHVTLGQAGRKQAFYALEDTYVTMLFASAAASVEAAEQEFTNEYEMLLSRKEA